jgi:hypothetical protein
VSCLRALAMGLLPRPDLLGFAAAGGWAAIAASAVVVAVTNGSWI